MIEWTVLMVEHARFFSASDICTCWVASWLIRPDRLTILPCSVDILLARPSSFSKYYHCSYEVLNLYLATSRQSYIYDLYLLRMGLIFSLSFFFFFVVLRLSPWGVYRLLLPVLRTTWKMEAQGKTMWCLAFQISALDDICRYSGERRRG